MNLLPHIRAMILRQRGGSQNWEILKDIVEAMTEHQKEAFFRTLKNAEEDGVEAGKRAARRQPGRFS